MKKLIYTFKNFPFKEFVKSYNAFEFQKLKEDLQTFSEEIEFQKPDLILGVAKSPTQASKFESKAVNKFNKTKKVDSEGIEEYLLDFPSGGFENISVNRGYSTSFCNWTMYKISQLIENKSTKLQFVHVAKGDMECLGEYVEGVQ